MARTICFAAGIGVLVAWNWGRLEQPRPSFGSLALMVLLGIAPALLPSKRWRLAGAAAALFVAAPIALDVSRPYALGKALEPRRPRVPRFLRRARPVRRRGASADARRAAPRRLHLHCPRRARRRLAPAARGKRSSSSRAQAGPRRSSRARTTSREAHCSSSPRSRSSRGYDQGVGALRRRSSSAPGSSSLP